MENKFYFTIEKGSNNGLIWVYDGEPESREENGLLNFTSEVDLLEALKIYSKGAVLILSESVEAISAGKNLAEKLGLQLSGF